MDRNGLVHFVASDAHNTRGRPLRLQPAYEVVREQFGDLKARALFFDNPMAAFEGRELPHVPEVAPDEKAGAEAKRFLVFLGAGKISVGAIQVRDRSGTLWGSKA